MKRQRIRTYIILWEKDLNIHQEYVDAVTAEDAVKTLELEDDENILEVALVLKNRDWKKVTR